MRRNRNTTNFNDMAKDPWAEQKPRRKKSDEGFDKSK